MLPEYYLNHPESGTINFIGFAKFADKEFFQLPIGEKAFVGETIIFFTAFHRATAFTFIDRTFREDDSSFLVEKFSEEQKFFGTRPDQESAAYLSSEDYAFSEKLVETAFKTLMWLAKK